MKVIPAIVSSSDAEMENTGWDSGKQGSCDGQNFSGIHAGITHTPPIRNSLNFLRNSVAEMEPFHKIMSGRKLFPLFPTEAF